MSFCALELGSLESKGLGLLMASGSRSVYERQGSEQHVMGYDEICALHWKLPLQNETLATAFTLP